MFPLWRDYGFNDGFLPPATMAAKLPELRSARPLPGFAPFRPSFATMPSSLPTNDSLSGMRQQPGKSRPLPLLGKLFIELALFLQIMPP